MTIAVQEMNRGAQICFCELVLLGRPFPLTPALSPGRGRIAHSRLAWRKWFGISEAVASCSLSLGERVRVRGQPGPALKHSHAAGCADRLTTILPLPEGEGRGEGKRDAGNAGCARKQICVLERVMR
jgi:hypothetical protein